MLREIIAEDIGLSKNKFIEQLNKDRINDVMTLIEIPDNIRKQVTTRNKSIHLIFEDCKYYLVPNAVVLYEGKYHLEIKGAQEEIK